MTVDDLMPFCHSTSSFSTMRWDIAKPFLRGDWVYSTNTIIIVRVPAASCLGVAEAFGKVPPESALPWADVPGIDGGSPLPVIQEVIDRWSNFKPTDGLTCLRCPPGTPVEGVCEECEGEGDVKLDNDFNTYICDCKSCDGTGSSVNSENLICKNCQASIPEAKHKPDDAGRVSVDGLDIDEYYYMMLLKLGPSVRVFATKFAHGRILAFSAGEMQGMLMSLAPEVE